MNKLRTIVADALRFLSRVTWRLGLVKASLWLIGLRSDVLWWRYKE